VGAGVPPAGDETKAVHMVLRGLIDPVYMPDTRCHTAPCGTPRVASPPHHCRAGVLSISTRTTIGETVYVNGSSHLKCGIYAEMSIRLLP